jgi:hypothetical protein
MADAKTRQQRMRERRQQAAMAALRQPGETVDAFFNRALANMAKTFFTSVGN